MYAQRPPQTLSADEHLFFEEHLGSVEEGARAVVGVHFPY
jgi:hypothetical protein